MGCEHVVVKPLCSARAGFQDNLWKAVVDSVDPRDIGSSVFEHSISGTGGVDVCSLSHINIVIELEIPHTVLHYETVHDTIQTRPHNWMSEVKLMPSLFDHASPVALEEGIFWQFTGDDAVNSNNFWFQPKARNHTSSFDL